MFTFKKVVTEKSREKSHRVNTEKRVDREGGGNGRESQVLGEGRKLLEQNEKGGTDEPTPLHPDLPTKPKTWKEEEKNKPSIKLSPIKTGGDHS